MGTKRKASPKLCTIRPRTAVAKSSCEREARHRHQSQRGHGYAEYHQPARLVFAQQQSHHGHGDADNNPARRKHQPAEHRRVTQQRLQEQRQQRGAAIEHEAEHQHGERGQREVALFEHVEIDHRLLLSQFPEHHAHQAHRRQDGERHDEIRGEPVVALPFVEHDFERTQTRGPAGRSPCNRS